MTNMQHLQINKLHEKYKVSKERYPRCYILTKINTCSCHSPTLQLNITCYSTLPHKLHYIELFHEHYISAKESRKKIMLRFETIFFLFYIMNFVCYKQIISIYMF